MNTSSVYLLDLEIFEIKLWQWNNIVNHRELNLQKMSKLYLSFIIIILVVLCMIQNGFCGDWKGV